MFAGKSMPELVALGAGWFAFDQSRKAGQGILFSMAIAGLTNALTARTLGVPPLIDVRAGEGRAGAFAAPPPGPIIGGMGGGDLGARSVQLQERGNRR